MTSLPARFNPVVLGLALLIFLEGVLGRVSQARDFSGEPSVSQEVELEAPVVAPDEPLEAEPSPPLRPAFACPEDFETLTALLVRDLPGYINRVLQRNLGEVRQDTGSNPLSRYRPPYVVVAGQLETVPLAIEDRVYTTSVAAAESFQQVFFTTLERQYAPLATTREVLYFHWLFLVPDATGWYLAFMFSTADNPETRTPILPPYESSQGSIGRAVQLWLRDCRAGAIAPLE